MNALLLFPLMVASLCMTRNSSAQAMAPVWTNYCAGIGDGADSARGIAVCTDGKVFVTGVTDYSTDGGYLTLGYSSSGVPLWTNYYRGSPGGIDEANAIAVDNKGKVFVTGESYGGSNNFDFATIAYSTTGEPLWTNRYNGASNSSDGATALVVDGNGTVFVTGNSADHPQVDPIYVTIAYSNNGLPLWTNRYSGPVHGWNQPAAIVADKNGNVFVTGHSQGGSNISDYVTLAYSGAGAPLWTNRYRGSLNGYDKASAVAVDNFGDVTVTGTSSYGSTNADFATIQYSGLGFPLWTNRYNGPANSIDNALSIAVNGNGEIFVTGNSHNIDSANSDYVTLAYTKSGLPLWTNRYGGPGDRLDIAAAVRVDLMGNVIVTGGSNGADNYSDFATVAYSREGSPLWTNRFRNMSNGGGQPAGLAIDDSGSVIISGFVFMPEGSTVIATIKYALRVPIQIEGLDKHVVLNWTNSAYGWTNLNVRLQFTPSMNGIFTNINGATTPYTNSAGGSQGFFRLIQE